MSTFRGESELPTLIYTGAEAEIYLQEWFGELAIRKQRIPKSYRVPVLDDNIRHLRTSHEATMLREARKLGVAVPTVQHIDQDSSSLIMDYIRGRTLKMELHVAPKSERRSALQSIRRACCHNAFGWDRTWGHHAFKRYLSRGETVHN